MARLAGTILRNGDRCYVQYEPHSDRYIIVLSPYMRAMLTPTQWARALATGEAQLIGKGTAA